MANNNLGAHKNDVSSVKTKTGLHGQLYTLQHNTELRIEAEDDEGVQLTLCNGGAEIFGSELVKDQIYSFPSGAKLAVYTWHSCEIVVNGDPNRCYLSTTTPMVSYLNLQTYLEQDRKQRENKGKRGSALMVCGPVDVGKSTLCRILMNYAIRTGVKPVYVDLDVGQGDTAIPGTMGALVIDKPSHPAYGFQHQQPIVYHFGHTSPSDNIQLYETLISQIAKKVHQRYDHIPEAKYAGCIINTGGWVEKGGYKALLHAAMQFQVSVVVVLDHEKLYVDMQRDLASVPDVKIIHLPKSGGVVARSLTQKKMHLREQIRAYFYGISGLTALEPHSICMKFDELLIFKISEIPLEFVPHGQSHDEIQLPIDKLFPDPSLEYHILALSIAEKEEDLLTSNCLGFVCVTDVNMEKKEVTLLSPQQGPLPRKYFIYSQLTCMDL